MDDKPNKMGGTPPEKTIANTPATEQISVAETASMYSESTTANNNMVPVAQRQQQDGVELQRNMLNHQVGMFALLSAGSFSAFLILSLPFSALVALLLFAASTVAVFYMLYRIVLLEMTEMMQGRGIGDYLPASIYHQLTTTSVHEWMMDSSFFLENRYLLLYFIPGTTQEQLDSYLERLPARHQYILTRPGLGQFMGSDFMRVIMGQSRYNALLTEDQREEELIEHGASQQLFENEESAVELNGTTERATRGLDQSSSSSSAVGLQTPPQHGGRDLAAPDQPPAEVVPQPMSTDPADVPEAELQQEYNDESDILTDAVAAMTTSYSTMITDAATGYAVQAVDFISPYIIGTGMTVTLGAMGVGIWGWWAGVYHPSSHRTLRFPSSRSLLSTAVMGASSAGMMMLFRSVARSAIQKDRKTCGDDPKKGDDEGVGKKK